MEHFAIRIMNDPRCATRNLSEQGGKVFRLWYFDKNLAKNTRKKGLAKKNFGVFSPRYS